MIAHSLLHVLKQNKFNLLCCGLEPKGHPSTALGKGDLRRAESN